MTEENENTELWRARAESAEAALSQMQAQMAVRVAQAELKAEAVRAGMIDLDGLKLIDAASIRLNQNGEIEDATNLLVRMKREKPWLFGAASSSSAANPPRPEPPRSRHANELSHEEWQSARAALIRRR
jgi:multidrug efflux pump subunit AcrA (membrane-fusion protein)